MSEICPADALAEALDKAKRRLGARIEGEASWNMVAAELGVSRQSLYDWRDRGQVSHRYAKQLADLSGVARGRLRPDIWDPPPKKSSAGMMADA